MCRRESLKFLGRVPVESGLVSLLDSTSKAVDQGLRGIVGSRSEAGPQSSRPDELGSETIEGSAGTIGVFDVLEQYKKTLSYRLFTAIAEEVVHALAATPSTGDVQGGDDGRQVLGSLTKRPEAEDMRSE